MDNSWHSCSASERFANDAAASTSREKESSINAANKDGKHARQQLRLLAAENGLVRVMAWAPLPLHT